MLESSSVPTALVSTRVHGQGKQKRETQGATSKIWALGLQTKPRSGQDWLSLPPCERSCRSLPGPLSQSIRKHVRTSRALSVTHSQEDTDHVGRICEYGFCLMQFFCFFLLFFLLRNCCTERVTGSESRLRKLFREKHRTFLTEKDNSGKKSRAERGTGLHQ